MNNQIKILILNKERIFSLTILMVMLGVITIAPLFHYQLITGVIVNAVLLSSAVIFGLKKTIWLAIIPSFISLGVGLLPFVLAPMIPFIIMGNIILITIFQFFRGKNYWFGMVGGSILKFVFLLLTSQLVIHFFIAKPVGQKIALMMSWPQLYTALAGGVLAYVFLRGIRKIENLK